MENERTVLTLGIKVSKCRMKERVQRRYGTRKDQISFENEGNFSLCVKLSSQTQRAQRKYMKVHILKGDMVQGCFITLYNVETLLM